MSNAIPMQFKKLNPAFIMPKKATNKAGAFDIYMPDGGICSNSGPTRVELGFAAAIPEGYVGLLFPRSGVGGKQGVELNNTCGVIDSDYRGEWVAMLKTKNQAQFTWEPGERVLQLLVVPIANIEPVLVDELDTTDRGEGGFGSTGK